jgi:formylglycine-generating enzyme required for sulfatase activity
MALPSPSDYQDTVQNPTTAFADPELRHGVVAVNHLGLPRVASGNFNSVYEMQCGSQRIAVRCMLRNFSDQQRRYDLVSRHLEGLSLPSLVEFAYLAQGIRVHGQWYPVVKMEWVEGIPLHIHVEQNLHNASALRKLAARWRGLVNSLRGSHLAHGDLQHGNALVTASGDLRLVDYDAMFVPALHGERSNEIGHSNYQHPKRDGGKFDERLDAFAALVIYVSLRAVTIAPDLWLTYHNGDNLLFKRSDFIDPEGSRLFKQLHRSPDPTVVLLSQIMQASCSGILADVPDLEQAIHATEGISLPASIPSVVPVLSIPLSKPSNVSTGQWWQEVNSIQSNPSRISVSPASPISAATSLQPTHRVNPKDGANMILIPAGEFKMGDPIRGKLKKVTLSGYYIYEKPVTVGQYRKFVEEMQQRGRQIVGNAAEVPLPHFDPRWRVGYDPRWTGWADDPVVRITWSEAAAYADWAGVRLPTEAEWEKAARGTDGRRFPWGDEFDDSKLWCSVLSRRYGTIPSGLFVEGASPFGVLDMAGNVFQWCSDWYEKAYPLSAPQNDPQGPLTGQERVARGSAWSTSGANADRGYYFRSASRFKRSTPDRRDHSLGFRCAL